MKGSLRGQAASEEKEQVKVCGHRTQVCILLLIVSSIPIRG